MTPVRIVFGILALALTTACAQPVKLHFKPADHALGDVHPFFHVDECYLFYLKPGKYDSTLVHSKNWLNWTPVELTHDPVKPDDWFAPYFALGVFRDEAAQVSNPEHERITPPCNGEIRDQLVRIRYP